HVAYDTLMLMDWPVGSDPTEHIRWLRAYWASIEPYTRGMYSNDLVEEPQQRVDRNYGGNFERLLALKNQYDPGNLFRLNANIKPTA
ncbi:MAG TPA: BBE domain-containing protein, partial [Woeseiaceae bacterium]|nr:BBE domain-containing protein [Woeseiaceae bacterium]